MAQLHGLIDRNFSGYTGRVSFILHKFYFKQINYQVLVLLDSGRAGWLRRILFHILYNLVLCSTFYFIFCCTMIVIPAATKKIARAESIFMRWTRNNGKFMELYNLDSNFLCYVHFTWGNIIFQHIFSASYAANELALYIKQYLDEFNVFVATIIL